MATPQGIQTVTIHGHYVEPDMMGTPLQGAVTFTPSPSIITFPDQNIVMSGTETAQLDPNGEFVIQLACTDTPNQNPDGWTYTVVEKLVGVKQRTYQILLPYTTGVVEIADITPTEIAPTFLPVVGPQGPAGLVQSVNGISTPNIVLGASDVQAVPTNTANQPGGYVSIGLDGSVGIGNANPWAKFMVESATDRILAAFVQTAAGATQPGFLVQGPSGTWSAFGTSVAGDVQNRFNFTASGGMTWGPGNAATDVGLDRTGVGVLTATGQMAVSTAAPTAVGHLTRKDYVDGLNSANVKLTGNQSISGTKTFSGPVVFSSTVSGSGLVTLASASAGQSFLLLQNTSGGATTAMMQFEADVAAAIMTSKVAGDTTTRFAHRVSGNMEFGPGNAGRDVTFYRSAAGVLNSSGQFASDVAAPTAASHLTRKDYVDAAVAGVSGGANSVTTNTAQTITAEKTYQGGTAATEMWSTRVSGDTQDRVNVQAGGKISWGSGSATLDSSIERTGAKALKVTGSLTADSFDLTQHGIFNVKNYGAKGDGVANDHTFIQSALSAATVNGGQVIVPPGVYLIGAVLRLYRNTRLTLLPGAEFRRNYAGTMLLNGDAGQTLGGYTGHGNITIEGGLWNMRGTTAGLTASAMCISIGHAQNVTIRDLEIRDLPGYHGIEINATKDAKIMNCEFRGYVDPGGRDFSEAIQPDGSISVGVFGGFGPYDMTFCEDIYIAGNYFGPSGTAGTTAWPRGIGSHSARVGRWHKRVRIIGNTFEGILQYGCSIYNYQNVTIKGNTFNGCGSSVRLRTIIASDTEDTKDTNGNATGGSQEMTNIAVVGNTMNGGLGYDDNIIALGETTGYVRQLTVNGNVLDTSTASENGIRFQNVQRAAINGNQINNISGSAISTEDSTHLNIVGNEIYTPGAHGITMVNVTLSMAASNQIKYPNSNGMLIQGGSDNQIIGNFIKSPGRGTNATYYGIRLSTSAASIFIRSNKVRPNGSGNEAKYGLSMTNTCSNIARAGNDFRGSQWTGGDTGTPGNVTGAGVNDEGATSGNTTATDLV